MSYLIRLKYAYYVFLVIKIKKGNYKLMNERRKKEYEASKI